MPQVAVTKIIDGPRNAVFHVFIEGNGSGELTDHVLVDPTSFSPALLAEPGLTLEEITYDLDGFSAKIEFDYLTTDNPVWSMSKGPGGHACFEDFGGLKDRSWSDGNGKLKITTTGLDNGDRGSIILVLRKS